MGVRENNWWTFNEKVPVHPFSVVTQIMSFLFFNGFYFLYVVCRNGNIKHIRCSAKFRIVKFPVLHIVIYQLTDKTLSFGDVVEAFR